MRVKPEASGPMSIENTQGCHCLYRDYHENIENVQNGKNKDISAMPSHDRKHRVTEA
jgi:hypothetical protein